MRSNTSGYCSGVSPASVREPGSLRPSAPTGEPSVPAAPDASVSTAGTAALDATWTGSRVKACRGAGVAPATATGCTVVWAGAVWDGVAAGAVWTTESGVGAGECLSGGVVAHPANARLNITDHGAIPRLPVNSTANSHPRGD